MKRLRYRSWHRGCKETDVILGHFADHHMNSLNSDELDVYERLLDEQDADIWSWLTGKTSPENKEFVPILERLRDYSISRYQANQPA